MPVRKMGTDPSRPFPQPEIAPARMEVWRWIDLARNGWGRVILKDLRLSTFIACPLRFKRHSDSKTRIEIRTVLEVDGNFGTIAAFFKECDRPDDFPDKVLTFNHGHVLSA
jgi:hypothetical protein